MSKLPGSVGLALLVGGVLAGAPRPALAQRGETRFILQQERLVTVLLGVNQRTINHQERAIAKQDRLLAAFPNATPAQQARLARQINQLNVALQAAKGRLISSLVRTEDRLDLLHAQNPSNPALAAQLQAFLGRADSIFANQLTEAEAIINRPPATPSSFSAGISPFSLGNTAAVRAASARVGNGRQQAFNGSATRRPVPRRANR